MSCYRAEALSLEFTNLFYKGNEKRTILHGVNGRFRPGYLCAILGPSGAGKTSLLNILSGFKVSGVTGSICINGKPRNLAKLKLQSCYITQEFAMLPVLTVRETLTIAACLKLGNKIDKMKKDAVVQDIATALGLKSSLDTRVTKLSGGEKKRVSIAMELITNPPIMFFDEPTSGLDSYSSLQVMTYLQSLARGGRTIIVVIHQPSSRILELIDDILLISGGQSIYNGPLNDLVPTFRSIKLECPQYYNRADFALEVACHERGDRVQELANLASKKHTERVGDFYKDDVTFISSCSNAATVNERSLMLGDGMITIKLNEDVAHPVTEQPPRYAVSYLQQFCILFKRSTICNLRDFRLAFLRIAAHIIVACLLGVIYYDFGNDGAKVSSNFSCIFFIVIFNFYGTAMHTVLTFPMESNVIVREYFNNWYSLGMYYLSKVFADLPLMILCPVMFLSIAYHLTGQLLEWDRFFMLLLVSIFLTIMAQSIGCTMGAAFNVQLALFLTATCTMPMFLISGFFVHLNDLSPYLSWLSYTSIFRYSLEAAALTVFGMNRDALDCSEDYCHFRKPSKFLEEMGMENGSYWLNISVLGLGIVITQLALYLTLHWKIARAAKQ